MRFRVNGEPLPFRPCAIQMVHIVNLYQVYTDANACIENARMAKSTVLYDEMFNRRAKFNQHTGCLYKYRVFIL